MLDAIGEPRTFEPALVAIGDDHPQVGAAAANAVRSFLHTRRGIAALDRLSDVATDPGRPTLVRVAAVQALASLDSATVRPLVAALTKDLDPAIAEAAVAAGTPGGPGKDPSETLADAAEQELPEDPDTLRRAVLVAGATIPVTVLQRVVERVRIREGAESGDARPHWTAVRAAAHAALGQRRSRLALYDLRETIESAKAPVAVEFLAALTAIGDSSCLDAIAGAYSKVAPDERHDWWARALADTFRAIARREGITPRHAVARRVDKRGKGLFEALTR